MEVARLFTECGAVWVNRVIRVTRTTAKPKIHLGLRIERPRSLTEKSDLDCGKNDMATEEKNEQKGLRVQRRMDSKVKKQSMRKGPSLAAWIVRRQHWTDPWRKQQLPFGFSNDLMEACGKQSQTARIERLTLTLSSGYGCTYVLGALTPSIRRTAWSNLTRN